MCLYTPVWMVLLPLQPFKCCVGVGVDMCVYKNGKHADGLRSLGRWEGGGTHYHAINQAAIFIGLEESASQLVWVLWWELV